MALNLFYLLITILFLLTDGPRLLGKAQPAWAATTLLGRLTRLGPDMVRYFGLRTYLNALTGLGVGIMLWLLGIDFAAVGGAASSSSATSPTSASSWPAPLLWCWPWPSSARAGRCWWW